MEKSNSCFHGQCLQGFSLCWGEEALCFSPSLHQVWSAPEELRAGLHTHSCLKVLSELCCFAVGGVIRQQIRVLGKYSKPGCQE